MDLIFPSIFIVIITHNGKRWYDRCLGSLKASENPVKIVVIDNASTDGTVEYITTNYSDITIIQSDKNLGFGQANNIGIKYALDNNADYVFLLNQDAWIEPGTLKGLIDIHKVYPEYGILSPLHLNAAKNSIEQLLLERIADYRVTDAELFNDLYFNRLKDVYNTKYVNAAAWLLPRKTLETVGGFDPFFFHYGEDDNYLNRVFYHGLKVGICPHIRIVHDCKPERKLYDENEPKILMMIRYTDINQCYSFKREMIKYLQIALTSLLRGRKKRAISCWKEYRFLKNNRQALLNSIQVNKTIGTNWLS
jgi:GT2 family glycosyltransferase